ncbi:hypothetical protein A6E01_19845 (plasmid) [Vibrio breoganii]|uniref:peptidyl-tRNA hydrolase n=1 Tax=Vibrio breoganii TaxID=553239 RepID=A0AAN0XZN4_9VIBR|nr:peptidyl-tRNA hydrolase [Vibrio breoganii]ANO35468.1 hypothetical protein A6E01_19845 [Vibrio breoganii]PML13929.1 hypothetical protein BCT84_12275 [Vibrio breoganii]
MSIKIFIRNDLDMPLGKMIAQAAHALNAAYLARFYATTSSSKVILTPTIELAKHIINRQSLPFTLIFGDEQCIRNNAESDSALIRDAGRTVFTQPTLTASWDALDLGPTTAIEDRLKFSVGDIPFKQPIIVNRQNPHLTPELAIQAGARLSTDVFLSQIDDFGNIHLAKGSPLLEYLTNGFGKTVIGTKRTAHHIKTVEHIIDGEGGTPFETQIGEIQAVSVFAPIASGKIEEYTKTKLTRLLDSL